MSVLVPIDAKTARETTTKLTATTAIAIYTAPNTDAIKAKLIKLRIVNDDASARNITVEIYDSSAAVSYPYYPLTALAADTPIDIEFDGLKIEKADELRVTASAANVVYCFLIVAEVQGRGG
jgi:hypothetical protein